jgi:hypothetical protein
MTPIENWHIGKVTLIAVIVAVCIGVISALTFLLTPSEIREYRVKLDDRGIYRVIAVVRYGEDFIAYQTTDGKEAIGITGELNDSLVRDNNGGPPHMKPTAWKRIRGAEAAENDRGRSMR